MIFVQKSEQAPPCLQLEKLKKSGNYNCEGVLLQNQKDFRNKCYLCEEKEITGIQTEHFKPASRFPDLKFEWTNLFFSCVHCNNTKLAIPKYDDILNCTILADEVETAIQYSIKNSFPKVEVDLISLKHDVKVLNTVDLLTAIYNGTTVLKALEADNLKSKLMKQIKIFQGFLIQYEQSDLNDPQKQLVRRKIERHLRSNSSFTAFKRWVIRGNARLMADFQNCLKD